MLTYQQHPYFEFGPPKTTEVREVEATVQAGEEHACLSLGEELNYTRRGPLCSESEGVTRGGGSRGALCSSGT